MWFSIYIINLCTLHITILSESWAQARGMAQSSFVASQNRAQLAPIRLGHIHQTITIGEFDAMPSCLRRDQRVKLVWLSAYFNLLFRFIHSHTTLLNQPLFYQLKSAIGLVILAPYSLTTAQEAIHDPWEAKQGWWRASGMFIVFI